MFNSYFSVRWMTLWYTHYLNWCSFCDLASRLLNHTCARFPPSLSGPRLLFYGINNSNRFAPRLYTHREPNHTGSPIQRPSLPNDNWSFRTPISIKKHPRTTQSLVNHSTAISWIALLPTGNAHFAQPLRSSHLVTIVNQCQHFGKWKNKMKPSRHTSI